MSDTVDFTAKMNYLAQKQNEGLIDVSTWSRVWERDGASSVPV